MYLYIRNNHTNAPTVGYTHTNTHTVGYIYIYTNIKEKQHIYATNADREAVTTGVYGKEWREKEGRRITNSTVI